MTEHVPSDVARLVVAARIVAFEDHGPEALRELDEASEAFADRVPWDNEPGEGVAITPDGHGEGRRERSERGRPNSNPNPPLGEGLP